MDKREETGWSSSHDKWLARWCTTASTGETEHSLLARYGHSHDRWNSNCSKASRKPAFAHPAAGVRSEKRVVPSSLITHCCLLSRLRRGSCCLLQAHLRSSRRFARRSRSRVRISARMCRSTFGARASRYSACVAETANASVPPFRANARGRLSFNLSGQTTAAQITPKDPGKPCALPYVLYSSDPCRIGRLTNRMVSLQLAEVLALPCHPGICLASAGSHSLCIPPSAGTQQKCR
ncbi:hypothetical protein IE81DRAFT_232573 [Ceraceosorus guamensis]|uniref:Uncharacterized protein n=1 Tax=Ceraceosorus guamensis TaxID=1522189 RepID=A0A316VRU6_9BASI|nr:hypothetical protein IE81DRAFT_232573 [Ceraceosorus guamensis]PWN40326.1 hypothetical protein IE81DRAFT_232573 [Ceraceosorus guamensis]